MSLPPVIYDCETYKDYFLVMFRWVETGVTLGFEMYEGREFDVKGVREVLNNNTLIGFNSLNYDTPIMSYALSGADNAGLKRLSDFIIVSGYKPWQCEKAFKFKMPKFDQIDLIEVAPGKGSLKVYGGRLHSKTIQDLPIEPSASITPAQRKQLYSYCANDLQTTIDLYTTLLPQIKLRDEMSVTYGMDLRSKSDAQIAEHVISREVEKALGRQLDKPNTMIAPFEYVAPSYVKFESEQLRDVLAMLKESTFMLSDGGKVILPKEIRDLKIKIGDSSYTMGIGGLHSNETSAGYTIQDDYLLIDRDVVSYYPSIILNNKLFPAQMGKKFLDVYRSIVDKRIAAKNSGDKVTADSLKITINGSFGKFGNKYSMLYSPQLLIQTTITGQLSLLMLIEQLELAAIDVVSANTDGIVIYCHASMKDEVDAIIAKWEKDTGFATEETLYRSIHSRDVNNYVAIKEKGFKLKGAYSPAGLMKNPTNEICGEAVVAYLSKGVPLETTIRECKDIRKFVTIRAVTGGAMSGDSYLGKVVRFYYSALTIDHLEYKVNGNKVPRSEYAMPLMTLPDEFPDDIDYNWYIDEANGILGEIGYEGARRRELPKKASKAKRGAVPKAKVDRKKRSARSDSATTGETHDD